MTTAAGEQYCCHGPKRRNRRSRGEVVKRYCCYHSECDSRYPVAVLVHRLLLLILFLLNISCKIDWDSTYTTVSQH